MTSLSLAVLRLIGVLTSIHVVVSIVEVLAKRKKKSANNTTILTIITMMVHDLVVIPLQITYFGITCYLMVQTTIPIIAIILIQHLYQLLLGLRLVR